MHRTENPAKEVRILFCPQIIWCCSSTVRIPGCLPGGCGFESHRHRNWDAAQWLERVPYTHKVVSSSLTIPTVRIKICERKKKRENNYAENESDTKYFENIFYYAI